MVVKIFNVYIIPNGANFEKAIMQNRKFKYERRKYRECLYFNDVDSYLTSAFSGRKAYESEYSIWIPVKGKTYKINKKYIKKVGNIVRPE